VFAAVRDLLGNASYPPSFRTDMRFLCVAMLRFRRIATKRPLVTLAIKSFVRRASDGRKRERGFGWFVIVYALGHKQTFAMHKSMSASDPKQTSRLKEAANSGAP
jgi:hypothetical protein